MHQHAHRGKNKTAHSSPQIEHYKKIVDYCSIKVGGGQQITTLDKYKIPVSIGGELPCMPLRPYTDKEWNALPHVILASDVDWETTFLDSEG